jgi:ATP-dependent Clp protease, protease subunit
MKILTIENKAAKLKLTEQVDKWSMDELIEEIDKTYGAKAAASGNFTGEITNCIENAADTLDIEIHSPGGSVLDGYRLYAAIKDLRARGVYVTANVTLAASMASVIAMAADRIHMRKGARMMIHEASAATMGDADTHRNRADLLESISDEIAGIYANRTGIPQDEIRESMKKETWMDGKQAVALKFADDFDTDEKEKGKTTKAMNILDRLTSPSAPEALEKIQSLEIDIANFQAEKLELENQLSTAKTALENVATEITELRASNESRLAQLELAEGRVEALQSELATLHGAAQVTEEKIAARAAELLAATGHPAPVAAGVEGSNTVTKTLFDQYRELQKSDPVAASKFWDEHESEIAKGL